ncbi:hypothetical protein MRX96_053991 [Rhipicephalus microplus]
MCSAASIDGAFNEFLWWTTHQQLLGVAAQCGEALCSSAGIGVKTCPAAVIDTCLRLHLDASAGFESWPHGHNSDSKEMCSAASIDGAFNEFLWWTTHQQLLGVAAQCGEALCSSAGIGVKTCPAAVIDTMPAAASRCVVSAPCD